MTVKVLDAICGSGKTSYAIQHINESPDKLFIYVTPFLSEVKRIKNESIQEFYEPEIKYGKGKKSNHIKVLVEEAANIVMTHELFARLDPETLMNIKLEGYTLIMDEVANVLNTVGDITKDDIRSLRDSDILRIEPTGEITWLDILYDGVFNHLKVLAMKKNLFIHNGVIIFWTMPVINFSSFEEVYILTYLFDGQIQKYYYDMHEIKYQKYSVVKAKEKYKLTQYSKSLEPREYIGSLLGIYEDYQNGKSISKLNTNYLVKSNKPDKALSKAWFHKANTSQIDQLRKNLLTFFTTQALTKVDDLFWTTFKSLAPEIKNKKCKINKKDDRSKDNFIPFNTRATNAYADKTAMAFVLNRFMNPNEKQFFSSRGIEVDEDLLATSDLIQFLFRGCIRNNKPMDCYIPSSRMRTLLKKWINYEI
ncbi:DEAD/DEAH box helicase family protein [Peribacillus sp. NPDC097198]|uniref:DEAD/DEAH box helicase family protein n=1 Tax=Peribacillus sp. NPDC097198 TaxID=3364397 RepID=UPI003821C072